MSNDLALERAARKMAQNLKKISAYETRVLRLRRLGRSSLLLDEIIELLKRRQATLEQKHDALLRDIAER